MSVIERCPTCGAAVRVVSGDEGTSHYEPITAIDALAKEVAPMAEQLRGAVADTEKVARELHRLYHAPSTDYPCELCPELWARLGVTTLGGQ